jgi:cold shock CspA family protein
MSTIENSTQTDNTIYNGQVKWFNNKSGYGFITIIKGERKGTDIFVHHSVLKISKEQYKYLVQGEYVDFNLTTSATDAHEFQAINVTGAYGCGLMCETRNINQESREKNSKKRKEVSYRD